MDTTKQLLKNPNLMWDKVLRSNERGFITEWPEGWQYQTRQPEYGDGVFVATSYHRDVGFEIAGGYLAFIGGYAQLVPVQAGATYELTALIKPEIYGVGGRSWDAHGFTAWFELGTSPGAAAQFYPNDHHRHITITREMKADTTGELPVRFMVYNKWPLEPKVRPRVLLPHHTSFRVRRFVRGKFSRALSPRCSCAAAS